MMRAVSAIVSSDDIEDIVQEAFIKSYEAELKQEIRYERTYMLKTACREISRLITWTEVLKEVRNTQK